MNKTINVIVCLNILILFLGQSAGYCQTSLYVSQTGSDANPATIAKPFTSIKKAVAVARKINGPVTIKLSGGSHYLSEPVIFTTEDAREKNGTLTITSEEGQKAIISGGKDLKNLKWKPYQYGIWQASVSGELVFDQLIVNGQLQKMARYPNYDPSARFLGGTSQDAVGTERAAKWKSPQGGLYTLYTSLNGVIFITW